MHIPGHRLLTLDWSMDLAGVQSSYAAILSTSRTASPGLDVQLQSEHIGVGWL